MGSHGKRTAAFLDVLGFRDALETQDLEEFGRRYESAVAQTNAFLTPLNWQADTPKLFTGDRPFCQWFIFSDSVILVSLDDSIEACLRLLIYAWRLCQSFLVLGLPLRGGVAFGPLYVNPQLNVCLGPALTRAYRLEEEQDWVGAAIDGSLWEAFPELDSAAKLPEGVFSELFAAYAVPLKDGSRRSMRTVNWRWNLVAQKGTRALFPESAKPEAARKRANALEYAAATVARGWAYVSDPKLPVELRLMFVGDKEPPFAHGDDL